MNPFLRVLLGIAATYGAGLAGYLFVDGTTDGWYGGLAKPPLTPPDFVFAIVWLVIYALMAGALAIVWTREPQNEQSATWVRFYFVQLLFNAAWTMFFFGLHSMILAFLDILILGFIVVTLIAGAWQSERRAAWLLAPYMAWLVFAGYLNLGMWFLN